MGWDHLQDFLRLVPYVTLFRGVAIRVLSSACTCNKILFFGFVAKTDLFSIASFNEAKNITSFLSAYILVFVYLQRAMILL